MDIFEKCNQSSLMNEVALAKENGLYPFFLPIEDTMGARVRMAGQEVLMLGASNYLGLSLDPRVQQAAVDAIHAFGTGCSGSRLLNGTLALHNTLERKLAAFTGQEAALCFASGYQTNLGALSALLGPGDHVFADRQNHASINDGILFGAGLSSKVNVHRYQHNSVESLEIALSKVPKDAPKLIVADSIFSMEGTIVDLPAMRSLADEYNARIYLDEAHSLGVIGPTGRGAAEHFRMTRGADIIMCTFSKSLGSVGGFIAGPKSVIDYVKHVSRPFLFSAALPPANAAAVSTSLDIIEKEPERITRLRSIASKMKKGFEEIGFNVTQSQSAVVSLVIGEASDTLRVWKALFERAVYTNTALPPAVPANRSMIRTSYMSIHSDADLDIAMTAMQSVADALNLKKHSPSRTVG